MFQDAICVHKLSILVVCLEGKPSASAFWPGSSVWSLSVWFDSHKKECKDPCCVVLKRQECKLLRWLHGESRAQTEPKKKEENSRQGNLFSNIADNEIHQSDTNVVYYLKFTERARKSCCNEEFSSRLLCEHTKKQRSGNLDVMTVYFNYLWQFIIMYSNGTCSIVKSL